MKVLLKYIFSQLTTSNLQKSNFLRDIMGVQQQTMFLLLFLKKNTDRCHFPFHCFLLPPFNEEDKRQIDITHPPICQRQLLPTTDSSSTTAASGTGRGVRSKRKAALITYDDNNQVGSLDTLSELKKVQNFSSTRFTFVFFFSKQAFAEKKVAQWKIFCSFEWKKAKCNCFSVRYRNRGELYVNTTKALANDKPIVKLKKNAQFIPFFKQTYHAYRGCRKDPAEFPPSTWIVANHALHMLVPPFNSWISNG